MLTQRSAKRIIKINHETTNYQHDFYAYWFYLMKEQEEKIMSENLNIDVAAMLNQLPPEMQKQMQAQMQTFINIGNCETQNWNIRAVIHNKWRW